MRKHWIWSVLLATLIVLTTLGNRLMKTNDMTEKIFDFELGKTLNETAAQTRLSLSGTNNWGLISAGVVGFVDGVSGRYAVPGYEIKVGPLSTVRFYSEAHLYPNKLVNIASLSVDTTQPGFTTHAEVYDYVYALIDQFQHGKWQRYFPEECPRLFGKASILDDQEIEALATPELKNWIGFDCSLDPEYKPPLEEWRTIVRLAQSYRWHDGQGRVATLEVRVNDGQPDGSLDAWDTRIDLEFEFEESIKDRIAGNREAELKEPWGARVPKVEAEKRRIRDILEQRARQSGEGAAPPLRAKAGERCPRAGMWQSQDSRAERRAYKEGEIMAHLDSAYGLTVWQYVGQN